MLRLIISGFLLSLLFSCSNKTTDLEKNSVRVTYKDLEPSDKVLELAGMRLYDKFDIEIYSDKTFYSVFAAYYSKEKSEKIDSPYTYNLLDYQFFAHNVFNQTKFSKFDTTIVYDKVDCFFRVDEKANVLLNNDSLYLSVMHDFQVAPIKMKIANSGVRLKGTINNFNDNEVIPLVYKGLIEVDYSKTNEKFMIIGMVISNHPNKIDFNKMLDSENVKHHLKSRFYDKDFKEEYPSLVSIADSFLFSK